MWTHSKQIAHWKIGSYFVGVEHRLHTGNSFHVFVKPASNNCACREVSASVPPPSSSGVDSGRGTFGLTPRPAQFAHEFPQWFAKVLIRNLKLADGDAYTGGAFGGSQGEQCPVADANFCDFQRQQLPRPDGRSSGLLATKTLTTPEKKTTAKNRRGRTYFPPGDVKHAVTLVVLRWRTDWPTHPRS